MPDTLTGLSPDTRSGPKPQVNVDRSYANLTRQAKQCVDGIFLFGHAGEALAKQVSDEAVQVLTAGTEHFIDLYLSGLAMTRAAGVLNSAAYESNRAAVSVRQIAEKCVGRSASAAGFIAAWDAFRDRYASTMTWGFEPAPIAPATAEFVAWQGDHQNFDTATL